ncbi:Retrovirus-related Pol polyprotein from transposon TNT 1-94 [Cucumis melo var. makuwa]|uniref:Retrovirus-related Pol polyprotein from transposon TNT 1-94 n=1 Tax=Cucumis melo var. makuwa TaxID=1194695 RepID=A0A5D3CC35_CUCMM|nr:Retrovirus-related Pol polyprotein from transposon TNT 1-94 [Cucumis melo var. makuwa]TYK09381.1 Retrovirus-related Pol polyprotein from transposon TNT 1-94 [Cucumis melo var. makuwa]
MDLDLALRTDKPASTKEQLNTANIEKWERSNRMKPTDVVEGTSQQNKKQAIENPRFFCKKKGYLKKDCSKYAKWRVKKGKLLILDCLWSQMPNDAERFIYVGDDDHSRYGYLYLIHEKSQSLDVFKSFKVEVELQLGKKIKVVKSDRGGEYYSRYDGSGEQRPGPFAKYLEECGIVPVPSKALVKTSYELWTGKKPSIRHLHVWGCPAEARPYRLNERKLYPRTISYYFVGYSEHSQGEDNIKKVVFEEELVSLPNVGIDDVHTPIPDFTMESIIE